MRAIFDTFVVIVVRSAALVVFRRIPLPPDKSMVLSAYKLFPRSPLPLDKKTGATPLGLRPAIWGKPTVSIPYKKLAEGAIPSI